MIQLSDVRKNERKRRDRARGKKGTRPKASTNLYRPILAIDGEGVTDRSGAHRYVMLAASDGSSVQARSLTTAQCFDYLLSLPKDHLIVGYSINYDICKWVQYIPKVYLEDLWRLGRCKWGPYSIRWAYGKQINISHSDGRRVHIYDVFGFFQGSFVNALKEWKVGTDAQVERIEEMKASRADFSDESADEMLAYCLEECRLLVQMVGKLRDAFIEGDIPVKQWYGAGAVAAAIMQKEGVKRYLLRDPPKQHAIPIMSAYFGGRFELSETGEHHDIWTYDIRSAYPHIATGLPCLTHAIYRLEGGYQESEWAIYDASWSVPDTAAWPPFPFREDRSRQILYPYTGRGWYHAAELRAAMRLFPGQISVHQSLCISVHCPPDCSGRPFAFIPDYFAFRQRLKEQGSHAQLTIKLGINSLYGKTAQAVGWKGVDGEAKKPPYQSYLWAGMITAGTRAMILDAISVDPEAVIWCATDGISSKRRLPLDVGDGLGEWEESYADKVFCVQPGIYELTKGDVVSVRSRGFGKRETDMDSIKRTYFADPLTGVHLYKTKRFIGLGASLARRDFWTYFGRWVEMQRVIRFCPSKRYPQPLVDPTVPPTPPIRLMTPDRPEHQEQSAPYVPRTDWVDMWADTESDELDLLVDNDQP